MASVPISKGSAASPFRSSCCSTPAFFPGTALLTGGFIGVDLFFVVSGYLITGLLIRERERTGRISFSRFYARRVRRILPAAAVTLLITIPLANVVVTLVDRSSVMEDAASAALSIANIRFAMTTDYFNPVNYSPFLHFWSLGVEEQFYFVWPALLTIVAWKLAARRRGRGPRGGRRGVLRGQRCSSPTYRPRPPSTCSPRGRGSSAAGGLLAVGAGSLDRLPGGGPGRIAASCSLSPVGPPSPPSSPRPC